MSLLDEVRDSEEAIGKTCSIGAWEKTLPGNDLAEFREALYSSFATAAIYRALERRGSPVSHEALLHHRRTVLGKSGGCKCRLSTT